MKQIVITGMGLVIPHGCGVQTVWDRLISGESEIRSIPETLSNGLPSKVFGNAPSIESNIAGFDPKKYLSSKQMKQMDG